MTDPGLSGLVSLLLLWLLGFVVALAIVAGGARRDEDGEP